MMVEDSFSSKTFCVSRYLRADGSLQDVPYRPRSLADAARFEPQEGVYTVLHTYNTSQVVDFASHLKRLADSAQKVGFSFSFDEALLRQSLRTMIEEANWGDVKCRIMVPREQGAPLILTIEPFLPASDAEYKRGVRCVTSGTLSRVDPEAKKAEWIHQRKQLLDGLPPEIHTVLLLDEEGKILEGVDSNFYGVLDGTLWTADAGILAGTSRRILLEVAPPLLPVHLEAIGPTQRDALQEAFLTSSSRGVLPVVEIDGTPIGDGKPGPFSRQLRAAYEGWIHSQLEDL